ncbi:MFS transporter [Pseudoduganella sp. FT26W]|uniref:MFS transporter n=1 Tax=Duganella aquatilis TaxID=2666082 RepID=A0A844D304_9BURK|nr:MFS transporter [Duganella aquatilis]MRW84155.1 MFS transporter [Duganella aquatilis]
MSQLTDLRGLHGHALTGIPAAAAPDTRLIGATVLGNFLEWYDWCLYGFLIAYIRLNFFPTYSDSTALILAFATFGAGFLMRPAGAVVIGYIGEKHGRKTALTITLLVMAAGTLLIAFIPSHRVIGAWAPALLLACRLLQGFSTGGELGGSLSYLTESAPNLRRGVVVSLQQASTHCGTLLGCGTATLLNAALGAEQMAAWGWRLPFLLGGALLLPIAWLLRRASPAPATLPAALPAVPASAGLARSAPLVIKAIGLIVAPVVCQYLFFTYMTTYAVQYGGFSQTEALTSNTLALAVMTLATPLMGALSDRYGRRPLLIYASLILMFAAAPAFSLVSSAPGLPAMLGLQGGLALVVSMLHGSSPVAVTELFPTQGRVLLVSVAYGLAVALAGGFAPLIAIWLIEHTGHASAPALYIASACMLTGWIAYRAEETAYRKLA